MSTLLSITSLLQVICHMIRCALLVSHPTFTYQINSARSRSLVEAHFKSLRLFRKYCRYMPFIIGLNGYRRYTTPEVAKLQLANYWRQHNKVRNVDAIDNFVRAGNERLYNVQNGDIWGSIILDQIAPLGRGTVQRN